MKKAKSTCYLCGKPTMALAFTKLGYDIYQCSSCQLYALDFPHQYHRFIKDYYNKKFFTGSPQRAGYVDYQGDSWPEKMNMLRYLHRIKRYKQGGRLLDCGCATGLFMQQAKDHGFDVSGFDVSAYAIRIAKKSFKDRVKLGSLSTVRYAKNSFDTITLFDVIEHLQNPRKDLTKIHNWLKKDGLLMINTGDTDSFYAQMEGKRWHFFIPPQHLFFFSRASLTKLLSQAGFKVIRIDYKGKWVSLRYLLNLMKQIQNDSLARWIYPLISHNSLGKLPLYINLFDNMVVYARPKQAHS